jgi:hypothetical protein
MSRNIIFVLSIISVTFKITRCFRIWNSFLHQVEKGNDIYATQNFFVAKQSKLALFNE